MNCIFLSKITKNALYFLVMLPCLGLANPNTGKNSVTVSGECRLEATADRGQLQLNVETTDKDVSKATKKLRRSIIN